MPSNHGKLIEDELMLALNNHRVMDLIPNLHYLMRELFGALEPEELVTCAQPDKPIKPDLLITYKGETKGLSVKSGTSEYVHGEPVEKFVEYLKTQGVSDNTVKTILLNQFGDGTIDGTGKERMDLAELKYRLRIQIKEANQELNNNHDILLNILDRMLFQGWDENAIPAYAIYHGDIYGVFIIFVPCKWQDHATSGISEIKQPETNRDVSQKDSSHTEKNTLNKSQNERI